MSVRTIELLNSGDHSCTRDNRVTGVTFRDRYGDVLFLNFFRTVPVSLVLNGTSLPNQVQLALGGSGGIIFGGILAAVIWLREYFLAVLYVLFWSVSYTPFHALQLIIRGLALSRMKSPCPNMVNPCFIQATS